MINSFERLARRLWLIVSVTLVLARQGQGEDWPPNPSSRAILAQETIATWEFRQSTDGWRIQNHAKGQLTPEAWQIEATGIDPMLESPRLSAEGLLRLRVRMRQTAPGPIQLFWIAPQQPGPTEALSVRMDVENDDQFHDYQILIPAKGKVDRLRFDPATGPGTVTIDQIRLETITQHPLEIRAVNVLDAVFQVRVVNHASRELKARVGPLVHTLPADAETLVEWPRPMSPHGFAVEKVELSSEGLPNLTRHLCVDNESVSDREWLTLADGERELRMAPDGLGARLYLGQKRVAVIAPLMKRDEVPVPMTLAIQGQESIVATAGNGVRVDFRWTDGDLHWSLKADDEVEGPAIRAIGILEQGLLAGVEHLGHGERSSSNIDLRGPEHIRFAPDRFWLTMPLMACVTDRGSIALAWRETTLQPLFAAPNFIDGTPDHRMAVRGRGMTASIRVGKAFADGDRLEDAIAWWIRRNGLPELPPAPRNPAAQRQLYLDAMRNRELQPTDRMWYHAIIPGGKKIPDQPHHFADLASTQFRLTGEIPDRQRLVHGGSHIANDAAFLLTGRGTELLAHWNGLAKRSRDQQQSDGSYRYDGPFRAGHFENTASGHCARLTVDLLNHVRLTGNQESLAAAQRSLEFMKRFRTPRGASVWECPLHAPDLLASAHLVRVYVQAFEITGNEEYRRLAVRWALSGVPYVYLWSERSVMPYATTGTLCATHYLAPVWIGRPVQWMGLVYADALLDLAPHDSSVDWKRLAAGILRSSEQMQYSQGPSLGLLPDSWLVRQQQAFPFDINVCTMVWISMRLSGEAPGLSIASDGPHRVVAPFPVQINQDGALIRAQPGVRYQIILNGERVLDVESDGNDRIPL